MRNASKYFSWTTGEYTNYYYICERNICRIFLECDGFVYSYIYDIHDEYVIIVVKKKCVEVFGIVGC